MRLKLKQLLQERGISQNQLAKAIGVSHPAVNAWINGRTRQGKHVPVNPDFDSLDSLCAFFEAAPGDLLQQEATQTPTGKTWKDFDALTREEKSGMGYDKGNGETKEAGGSENGGR